MHQNKIQFWCAGANEKRTGPNQREVRAWCRLVERARRTLSNNNCEVAMVEFAAGGGEGRWSLVMVEGYDIVVSMLLLLLRCVRVGCSWIVGEPVRRPVSSKNLLRHFPAKTFPRKLSRHPSPPIHHSSLITTDRIHSLDTMSTFSA